ncbi:hypothetical protein F5X99DRAFT_395351 [Biscogniauxia marginata]|nr:hypothetical protein F5X99DRAFT_395351 [Biscogniauxia marginata]
MHLLPPEAPRDEFFIQMNSAREPAVAYQDHLGDVFGLDTDLPEQSVPHGNIEISLDSRRLQTQHTTEGYREGITVGKAESIQAGFDEAFGLGANIGLKAGQILGLLEGLAAARHGRDTDNHSAHADQLLLDGRNELKTEVLFDEEYWEPNGNWKYHVRSPKGDDQIVFEHIASEHPVILKWTCIVDQEFRRWDLDRSLPVINHAPSQQDTDAKSATVGTLYRRATDW